MTTHLQTIDMSQASLPATYVAAVNALANCESVDECQSWANKAIALATYAKQAQDERLLQMATRIKARAIRRAGELLRQIPAANGANQNIQDGTVPIVTRTSAATDAGLSERQRRTALRVAAVPADEFEAAVESATPPTITQLANAGTQAQPQPRLHDLPTEVFLLGTEISILTENLLEFCSRHTPEEVARGVTATRSTRLRQKIDRISAWLDALHVHLEN